MIPFETLYTATVIGAVAMVLLLKPGRRALRLVAAIAGLGAFGGILVAGLERLAPAEPGTVLPTIFGAIAVISAVRMITLSRPVLAALHFVLVVLASSAMFLLLQAEFMAFALIIVYAGAILITYLFVLMLARQSPTETAEGPLDYDSLPREPLAACTVGFVMLASIAGAIVADADSIRETTVAENTRLAAAIDGFEDLEAMPRLLDRMAGEAFPGSTGVEIGEDGRRLRVRELEIVDDETGVERRIYADATVLFPGGEPPVEWTLTDADLPGNTRLVGMKLVASFPISHELAGVILLMAMFGAVVLARRQIELGEDERRAAAGLGRLSVEDPDTNSTGGTA